MKATPQQQRKLLDLQQIDLRASRLRHQIANHELREKLVELQGRGEDLQRYAVRLQAELGDRERDVALVEGEIQKVRTRREAQQERLDGGKIGIRDMSAVEHEIARMQTRQDELEAQLFAKMEEAEAGQAQLAQARAQGEVLLKEAAEARDALTAALVEPEAQSVAVAAERDALRAALDADLLAEYDRLRERQGPIVVLHLEDGVLVNAPVSISQEELDAASSAPADELWVSDETGYLVARPA